MEGVPFFPEYSPDDEQETKPEKKDKKDSKDKKLSIFEKPKEEKNPEKLKDDKPEKKDQDVPLEKLAEDEKQHIASEVAAGLKTDNQQELLNAPEDSPEEQEALVGATFAEVLEQELEDGTPVEEAIESAVQKTQDIAELEPIDSELTDEDEPDDDQASSSTTPVASTTSSTVPPILSGSGSGSGSGKPPTPPTPPSPTPPTPPGPPTPPPGPGPIPMPIPPGPPTPGPNFNLPNLNPNITANTAPQTAEVRNRRRESTNLLVGGVIGYMIGRRRGRIKTEKKLIPVQKKLEKQVKNLENTILDREQQLRSAARVRYEQNPASVHKTIQRMEQLHTLRQTEKSRKETRPTVAQKPEKLGKFVVLAERPNTSQPEKPQPVQQMRLPELLALAAAIKIENSSVKQLYETGRINERNLRRVIEAYTRGERYDHMLRESMISPEVHSDQAAHEHDPMRPLKTSQSHADSLHKVLQDQGMSSTFALPVLNHTESGAPDQPFTPRIKRKKSAKPIISVAAIALALLFILWLVT